MHRQAGSVAIVGVVLILVILILGTTPVAAPSGRANPGPSTSPSAGSGSLWSAGSHALAWAESSLFSGAGPAHGMPMSCADATSSLGCASARTSVSPVLSPGLWSNITNVVTGGPSGRISAMTWDASDGYVLLYGGLGCGSSCILGDTWTFSAGVWTNITLGITGTPGPDALPGLAFDPSTGKVIMFGGAGLGTVVHGATWAYHAKAWTNLSATVGSTPPARAFPAMATDTTDGEIVMTGGTNGGSVYFSDTWVFKNGVWNNDTSIAGSAGHLSLPTASDDPAESGVLLVGPQNGTFSHSSTLVYSGGAWRDLTSTLIVKAPSMELAAAAYLPSERAVIVFTGVEYNATAATTVSLITWEFKGGAWSNCTDLTGPQPTDYLAATDAVDPTSDALIRFGGETITSSLSPATYVLSGAPLVSASASKTAVDAGMAVTLTATVSRGLVPNTVSWDFNDGSANASGTPVVHSFSSPGLAMATVTVTSFVGVYGTATVSVFVNAALGVAANASAAPTAGSLTSFSAAVTGGTGPFTYAWTFGDTSASSASAAPNPSHTYSSSGTYSVSLKVTDSAGANITKTFAVVVASAPSTSASLTSGTGLGLLLGIIILLVVVVALAILLMRKPKSPVMMAPAQPPIAPYAPPPPPPSG